MYRDFVEVLGNPVLLEQQRLDRYWRLEHRAEMNRLIEAETQKWHCDELLEKLQARGVPCGPVNDMERAFSDPQVLARNMVVEGEFHGKTYRMPGNPVKMSGTPSETFGPAPALGEHNEEVYQGLLKKSAAELDGLRSKGLI
jgi:crotonobetainyl-CoA:carnitine CoA-transferase CaiB-like acyl-CoA transferase